MCDHHGRDIYVTSMRVSAKDETWEDKCTDSYGYSWCTPKAYPCPITCAMDEQAGAADGACDRGAMKHT